jgi:hypothetical protein
MTRIMIAIAGLVWVWLAVAPAQAQPSVTPGDRAPWTMPRTPDGQPNLQGLWTTQTFTPLQRAERFGDRAFLTDEEMAEVIQLLTTDGVDPLSRSPLLADNTDEARARLQQADPTHYDNAMWLTTEVPKTLSSSRTSLIVEPRNGRIPPMLPAAQERAGARRAARSTDGHLHRPYQERCLTWSHEGPPMIPPPYNDIYQIFQSPGYVVVFPELNANQVRIIPTDGRPQVSSRIRQWPGNSVGRWDGDTLVVDTSNFTAKTAFQGSSDALHVVERFTRVDAETVLYEFTVEDPQTWSESWTAEIPMKRTGGRLYEYACHEGNYGIRNTLRGARVADRRAAAAEER